MSSLDQILGRPDIPVYGRDNIENERIKKKYKQVFRIYEKRRKLWQKKGNEFDKFDLDFKERFWKYYQKRILQDPHLKFWWDHQWWTLTKKNFKKFKWFYD